MASVWFVADLAEEQYTCMYADNCVGQNKNNTKSAIVISKSSIVQKICLLSISG